MTTQESTHILSYYAAQLMHTCHCYIKAPVSGEVKLKKPYLSTFYFKEGGVFFALFQFKIAMLCSIYRFLIHVFSFLHPQSRRNATPTTAPMMKSDRRFPFPGPSSVMHSFNIATKKNERKPKMILSTSGTSFFGTLFSWLSCSVFSFLSIVSLHYSICSLFTG